MWGYLVEMDRRSNWRWPASTTVYRDKHIMCACIPVDAYKEEVEA